MGNERIAELSGAWLREQFNADGSGSNMDKSLQALIRTALLEVLSAPPTEEMWGGLARDIIFWHDMDSKRTPESLFLFLDRIGREIPQWLRDEPELKNLDHAISKGTRAVIVYKAMTAKLQETIAPKASTERRE